MSDFDELPFDSQPGPPSLAGPITPRKHRHSWVTLQFDDGIHVCNAACSSLTGHATKATWCSRCHAFRDDTRYRRGKSSRRLGHDGERRSEKRYGFRKVGEFGGIDDLVGKLFVVQQKTTRRQAPGIWKGIFARLDERAMGRVPAILLSFVKAGVDTEDFFILRGRDWLALHGTDEPE